MAYQSDEAANAGEYRASEQHTISAGECKRGSDVKIGVESFEQVSGANGEPLFIGRRQIRNEVTVTTWQITADRRELHTTHTEWAFMYDSEQWERTRQSGYTLDLIEEGSALEHEPHKTTEQWCRDKHQRHIANRFPFW